MPVTNPIGAFIGAVVAVLVALLLAPLIPEPAGHILAILAWCIAAILLVLGLFGLLRGRGV